MRKIILTTIFLVFVTAVFGQSSRVWGTYYGGPGMDLPRDITTDINGNVILTGQTESMIGMGYQGFQMNYGGQKDAFLLKADAAGNLLWATYYGGMMTETGNGVAADASGNIYMAGNTGSISGIATPGAFLDSINNPLLNHGFLAKFDAGGNRVWATYFAVMGINDVACDADGNIYIAGMADSLSVIPGGGFQQTSAGQFDGFLAKFNPFGNLIWATYYGGQDVDVFNRIAVDVLGNVYATGWTESQNGIASGGFQNTYSAGSDAFIVKFDAAGNRIWASYYGSTGYDAGQSVATDKLGNVYLAGGTGSTSGIASGGFQNVISGLNNFYFDCFLVKFDSAGNRVWATYYGGQDVDNVANVDVDLDNNVYLSGGTQSSLGIASGGFQNNLIGNSNSFVAEFDQAGNRLCATYYNNDLNQIGYASFGTSIATDNFGNVFHCGNTNDVSGIASGGFQNVYGGGIWDSYIVKFTSCFANGIEDQKPETELLFVYPNPFEETFTIRVAEVGNLKLFNALGELVYALPVNAGETNIVLPETAAGIYTLQFNSENGNVTRKLISK